MKGRSILVAVCEQHNVTLDEMLGPSRLRVLVKARVEAANRMRGHGMPVTLIAKIMRRDRTTIDAYIYPKKRNAKRAWNTARYARIREARQ